MHSAAHQVDAKKPTAAAMGKSALRRKPLTPARMATGFLDVDCTTAERQNRLSAAYQVGSIVAKFYRITFAWKEAYQGLLMKDPEMLKMGAEHFMNCTLYQHDGKTLNKLGEHTFREEDEVDSISVDIPESVKVVESRHRLTDPRPQARGKPLQQHRTSYRR